MGQLRKFLEEDHHEAEIIQKKKKIKIGPFFEKISVNKSMKKIYMQMNCITFSSGKSVKNAPFCVQKLKKKN